MRYLMFCALLFLILGGCKQNALSGKSISSEVPTSSKKYSSNLLDALDSRNSKKYVFHFSGYKQLHKKEYINVKISGNGLNSEIPVLVRQWHKLEQLKQTRGIGYNGAELRELSLTPVNDSIAKFEYKSIGSIID